MLDRLKSLPLTMLLSVLIWMYAEAQFTYVQDGVTVNVDIGTPTPELSARVFDGTSYTSSLPVVVNLQGPKNQIDRILRDVTSPDEDFGGIKFTPTMGDLTKAADGAPLAVDWLTVLNRLEYFRAKGVRVTSASPQRVRVEVDRMRRIRKQVEYRAPSIVDHFSLSPDIVEIAVPAKALSDLGGEEKITVLADPIKPLENLQADSEQTVPARFVLQYSGPRDERIRVLPVQGTLTVHLTRQQQVAQTISDVPVWISGPPPFLARYDVEVQPKTVRLTVAGTAAAIDALRRKIDAAGGPSAAGVYAFLDLTTDDRPAETMSRRRVRPLLPDGITLVSSSPDVAYRVMEHVNSPPTSPAPAATTPAAPTASGR